jgi:CheY-like chemotaxis protein
LPCCVEQPAEQDTSARVPIAFGNITGTIRTVLLIEDEESFRIVVSKMLSKNGFSVVEAGDGCAAIDLWHVHQKSIDAIVLDLTLPGTPSREIIAEVQRTRPTIKVILMSAYSREVAAHTLDAMQIKAFIRKPFQIDNLIQLLRDTSSG